MEKKIFGPWRRRRTGKVKEENIFRRKKLGQGRKRRMEKEKEENILRGKSDDRQTDPICGKG